MVHLWDRGGTHETARGGFFGRKNAKKLTFFAKKSAKKKKIKKIKGLDGRRIIETICHRLSLTKINCPPVKG